MNKTIKKFIEVGWFFIILGSLADILSGFIMIVGGPLNGNVFKATSIVIGNLLILLAIFYIYQPSIKSKDQRTILFIILVGGILKLYYAILTFKLLI